MKDEQSEFDNDLKDVIESVDKLSTMQDRNKYNEYANQIIELDKSLNQYIKKSVDYNEQEHLFGTNLTEYPLKEIYKKFEIYKGMWVTTRDFKKNYVEWLSCKWETLNGSEVESNVQNYKILLNKSKKVFKSKDETLVLVDIIDEVLNDLTKFEKFVPLAVNLRVQGMLDRHWDQLSKTINKDINPKKDPEFNLQKCIDYGLLNYIETIEDISNKAIKEYGIRSELDKMYSAWKGVEFD